MLLCSMPPNINPYCPLPYCPTHRICRRLWVISSDVKMCYHPFSDHCFGQMLSSFMLSTAGNKRSRIKAWTCKSCNLVNIDGSSSIACGRMHEYSSSHCAAAEGAQGELRAEPICGP